MYHEYSDSLKRMPDSEIKYINKVLKENCTDNHFDIILIFNKASCIHTCFYCNRCWHNRKSKAISRYRVR